MINEKRVIKFYKVLNLVLIILIVLFSFFLVVQPTKVNGQSMYPTIEHEDYLLVNKLAYINLNPERGDIVVFRSDLIDEDTNKQRNLVKRVIALPGEHLEIYDNKVYINGQCLQEEYLIDVKTYGYIDIVIPDNEFFAMGDNREFSNDSRNSFIGTVLLDDIIGKVTGKIFPKIQIGCLD